METMMQAGIELPRYLEVVEVNGFLEEGVSHSPAIPDMEDCPHHRPDFLHPQTPPSMLNRCPYQLAAGEVPCFSGHYRIM